LAARLTGWKIDIKSNVEYEAEQAARAVQEAEAIASGAVAVEEPVAAVAEEAVAEEAVVAEEVAPVAEVAAVEEPVAEEAVAEEVVAEVAPVEEAPAVEEVVPTPVPTPASAPASRRVPVAAAEPSASLRDVPDDIWSIRRARRSAPDSNEPGQIRFAEDIAGLRGGVTASRRGRRRDDPAAATTQPDAPKRKTKAGKRRR